MNALAVCYRHPKFRGLIYMLACLLFLLFCLGGAMYMGVIDLDPFAMSMLAVEVMIVAAALAAAYWKWREIGHRKRLSEIKQYRV